jgi:hypothetical protein
MYALKNVFIFLENGFSEIIGGSTLIFLEREITSW